jgi:redox-regulated HSP33 family molecular chaperone
MNLEDIEYRRYNYGDDNGFISQISQIYDYLDKKFSSVNGSDEQFEDINSKLCHIDKHIECAKNQIIKHNCSCESEAPKCTCNVPTKQDIKDAVEEVNLHTDSKFSDLKFEEFKQEFTDLNEEVKEIKKKIYGDD